MARIPGPGVQKLPTLDGWAILPMGTAGGLTVLGLQLQQPDGARFLHTVHEPDPDWLDAAARGWVLVLHGPRLGLREHDISGRNPGYSQPGGRAQALLDARTEGLVTGGLVTWGRPAPS